MALVLCVPGLFQVASPPPLWVVFGWSTPVAVAALLFGGPALAYAKKFAWQVRWWAVVAGELFMLALLGLSALYTFAPLPVGERLPSAQFGHGGGLLGLGIFRLLILTGKPTAAWIIVSALLLLAGWLLWRTLPWEWTAAMARIARKVLAALGSLIRSMGPDEDAEDIEEPPPFPGEQPAAPRPARSPGVPTVAVASPPGAGNRSPADGSAARPALAPAGAGSAAKAHSVSPAIVRESAKNSALDATMPVQPADKAQRRKARPDTLPSYDLLRPDDEGHAGGPDQLHRAQIIKETLAEFGVPVEIVSVKEGPTVTQFGLEPGEIVRELSHGEVIRRRVSVATIQRLSNDLALALAATAIRIEAPVPGRPYVGVEMPNAAKTMVSLRSILEARDFAASATARAWRLPSDATSPATRWSPTWRACPTCSSPAQPARASPCALTRS